MATGGFPNYLQTDNQAVNYGLTGQLSPEAALKEQALNRRRAIANLLVQQGMQPLGGKMVGRFYVADSPIQGLANLAKVGIGSYLTNRADDKQQEVAKEDQASVQAAIRDHQEKMRQREGLAQAMIGVPPPAAPATPQGSPTPEPAPLQPPMEPFRGIAPRPDGPYQGEVGAVPMLEPGVQSAAPPIQAMRPESIAGQTNMQGLDMANAQPADMSQFAPQPTDAQTLPAQAAPAPTTTTAMPAPAPRKPSIDDLADLLTHQHPQVRAYGALLAQQMQREQERDAQQSFLSQEKALDRDVRKEGILENSRMREAQLQNTMALTQMQIEARMQQGRDANDLKASLAQQSQELAKLQMQNAKELKKAEIDSRKDIAKQHDETLKAVAGMKADRRGTIPASALKMQQEELDAIGTASSMKSDMTSIRNQIDSGQLKLGLISNLAGTAKNKLGMSDESSRNLASFKATLEKMRNDSLRLNKGVQTEGDAVRAWNELMDNVNDPALVKQRLSEIEAMNDRAVNLRRMNIDTIRQNFGAEPLDTTGFENQPAAVGANKGPAIGTVDGGYRFKGGNPADPNSWEKVR